MKILFTIATAILLSTTVSAQVNSHSYDGFYFQPTLSYSLNKPNLRIDTRSPSPLLIVSNTLGYSFSAGYKHVTRFGLILQGDFGYAYKSHKLKYHYDLTDYNYDAKNAMSLRSPFEQPFEVQSRSLRGRFLIGYLLPVARKKYFVEAKTGLSLQYDLDSYHQDYVQYIVYTSDDGQRNYVSPLYHTQVHFFSSHDKTIQAGSRLPANFHFYLGAGKPIHSVFFKSATLGIEFTNSFYGDNGESVTIISYDKNGIIRSNDDYWDKKISIGLAATIVF